MLVGALTGAVKLIVRQMEPLGSIGDAVPVNAETHFLQSRQERWGSKQRSHQQHRSSYHCARREALDTFWCRWREEVQVWKLRLGTMDAGVPAPDLLWPNYEEQLKQLRRMCFHEPLIEPVLHAEHECYGSLPSDLMTPTDLGLLFTELATCQQLLEQQRRRLVPRGKFIFKRYRKALAEQQQQQLQLQQQQENPKSSLHPNGITDHPVPESKQDELGDVLDADRTVWDFSNRRLVVKHNGTVWDMDNREKLSQLTKQLSSPLLHSLHRCYIELIGNYHSIHIVSVSECTLHVIHPIQGPVHITNCHGTQFWLGECHQLRIHNSQQLQFHNIQVTTGAILEDSTKIWFGIRRSRLPSSLLPSLSSPTQTCIDKETGENVPGRSDAPFLDVKDFCWLKLGVPSPNYRIQWEEQVTPRLQYMMEIDEGGTGGPNGAAAAATITTAGERDNMTLALMTGEEIHVKATSIDTSGKSESLEQSPSSSPVPNHLLNGRPQESDAVENTAVRNIHESNDDEDDEI